ncbi:Oidioi.mRNA.OKI2018_I69.chr2.g7564.t1.cds [Oikopleura dioica]|uniref:Oidioi.mRNA.OKI2018_I69.chr2.g7564.t1.cds n=1 Tax=Oikopleura dioica TaxID=34765 RepID=A0ABN7TBB7_OIKDI|nr:Oidioi.mRNA.OKI2018_I69.chr2.g7564.t1.cds [Oikopleura dioica]
MKISNLIFGSVVLADDSIAGIPAIDRGVRPDMAGINGVKCPKGGRPAMGGMCIPDDTVETPLVTENIDIDGIGKLDPTEDPLNGQGNMFGPQNAFPGLQESSTDSMTTTSRPKPPPPSTMPPAINTTEKKTAKPADPVVPMDDRNAVNTDEPSNDGVNSLPDKPAAEASESTEEDPSWWIWPLTCVGIGTVLLGVSIYACQKNASPPAPTQYLPGQIIGQESTVTKDPPAQNSFPNGTSSVTITEQQQTTQQLSISYGP